MHMKKIMVLVSAIILLNVTPLLAITGPIPIDESNVLPDGPYFGSVTITSTSPSCVDINVNANETLLVPLPNFGIQAFGFNAIYTIDSNCLDVTAPTGWVEGSGNMDGFGYFMERVSGDGQTRDNPVNLQVCSTCGDLAESDIVVKNTKGYTFAVHIADFIYDGITYTGTSSAFFATQKTTQIELSLFTAKPGNGSVTLKWVTETEIDNAGFNILRAEKKNGDYTQINEYLIPSEGSSVTGANYEFSDDSVKNGKTYWYKLQSLEVGGMTEDFGPVEAKPKKGL
jgi:hypothetical protein